MPVSHAHRCVFVHIPKTGGTSVEAALGVLGDWRHEDRDRLFGLVQSPDLLGRSPSAFLQHFTAAEIRALLPRTFDDYFTFAFVRNPWDRLYSAFSRKDPHMVETAAARGLDLPSMSLEQFIDTIPELPHVHLRPQVDFVRDDAGRLLVDFIGRFETFAADFAAVGARIGAVRDLPHLNPSAKAAQYREAYSERARRAVADIYRDDIEAFRYGF